LSLAASASGIPAFFQLIRSGYSLPEVDSSMNLPEFQDLDLSIARARIFLSLIAMLSLYIDPSTAGGLFHLNAYALTTLLCHLTYSVGVYLALSRRFAGRNLQALATGLDLFFATAVAFITEGQTSAAYVFFVFAIVASVSRARSRPIVTVTFCSVALYLLVIVLTHGISSAYVMRAVYLAIAGYLIDFFSQQRALFEAEVRELETRAERQSIARSLHDGYVQALAGVNLRLETCRALLNRNRPQDALLEITDLQTGVAREYDAVRIYLRSLAGIDREPAELVARISDPGFEMRAAFSGRSLVGEHILQIMLEGLRNSRSHGMANLVKIDVHEVDHKVSITIEDDGVGLSDSSSRPWAIASRVAELQGHMSMHSDGRTRLQIELPNG
jgi:signal transduction histidine kinase